MSNQNLNARPRRNRKSSAIRNLCRETSLVTESLIYPVFIHDKNKDESIESMPGCTRWSLNGLLHEKLRDIPKEGDKIIIGKLRIIVEKVLSNKPEKIRIEKIVI